jgi:hypothetical protein
MFNFNNPSKEIWASTPSGIFHPIFSAITPYAPDIPLSNFPNTSWQTTTTSTTTTRAPEITSNLLLGLGSGNYFIDDMLVFNSYIHYDTKSSIKSFNPQSLLEQSVTAFNAYSLEYR